LREENSADFPLRNAHLFEEAELLSLSILGKNVLFLAKFMQPANFFFGTFFFFREKKKV